MSRRRRRRGARSQQSTTAPATELESPLKRERWLNVNVAFAFGTGMFIALMLWPAFNAFSGLWFGMYVVSAALLGWSFGRIFVRSIWLQRRQQRRQESAQSSSERRHSQTSDMSRAKSP